MVDSAPPVLLASASSRTVVGARPTVSAPADRTTTDSSKEPSKLGMTRDTVISMCSADGVALHTRTIFERGLVRQSRGMALTGVVIMGAATMDRLRGVMGLEEDMAAAHT